MERQLKKKKQNKKGMPYFTKYRKNISLNNKKKSRGVFLIQPFLESAQVTRERIHFVTIRKYLSPYRTHLARNCYISHITPNSIICLSIYLSKYPMAISLWIWVGPRNWTITYNFSNHITSRSFGNFGFSRRPVSYIV